MTRLQYASTKDPNMLYLLQHRVTDPLFFLEHEGVKRIFLGSVNIEAFQEEGNRDIEAVDVGPYLREAAQREGDALGNLAKLILGKFGVSGKVTVPSAFPVSIADFLRERNVNLSVQKNFCPERLLKSQKEISAIKENFINTKKAFELVEQILKDSEVKGDSLMYDGKVLTSEILKRETSKLLLDFDLENTEGIIISCGDYAAMPHHDGTGPIRPHESIIVDIFPQSARNQYFADMTRTYVKGEARDEIKKMYEAVEKTQHACIDAAKPGVTGKELYELSATLIQESGYDVGDKGYTHSLGHGLGIEVHELPNLGRRSDVILEVGHVVTFEPGLYYRGLGGVRIEDTVVITKEGYENLTNYPQNWLIS